MKKLKLSPQQEAILAYLSNRILFGTVDVIMYCDNIVKVTDMDGVETFYSIDGSGIVTCASELDSESLMRDMETYTICHYDKINQLQRQSGRHTLVISAFGGPGSGKTVACMDICQQLKKHGYNAEYVSEVPKDYVYDEQYHLLDGTAEHQYDMLKKQLERVDRYIGKVDFVVTDSPVLLNGIYNRQQTKQYESLLLGLHNHYNNFVFFVERDAEQFQQEGRIHDLQESKEKDLQIQGLLKANHIYYGTYNHKTVWKIVENSIRTLKRI